MRRCLLGHSTSPPVGLEDWVFARIENPVLKQTGRGRNVYGDCPFCHKTDNHFSVNLDTGLYKCYICGDGRGRLGGNYVDLVARLERIPYREVDSFLYGKAVTSTIWNIRETEPVVLSEVKHRKFVELEGTIDIKNTSDVYSVFVNKAVAYLDSRSISVDLAQDLGMRVGVRGKYVNRILIPIVENGEVVNFVARDFTGGKLRYTGPSLADGWQPKSDCIFNIDNILQDSDVLLVEGIFDAIPLRGLSVGALLGKVVSDKQLVKILKLKPRSVTILLDGDGETSLESTALSLASRFYALVPEVRYAIMPAGLDPADAPRVAENLFYNAEVLL